MGYKEWNSVAGIFGAKTGFQNAAGDLDSMQTMSGSVLSYTRDVLGRVVKIAIPSRHAGDTVITVADSLVYTYNVMG